MDGPTAEHELGAWLRALDGAPPVTDVVLLACDRHGDEPQTWGYVEADPRAGVARRRCLSCGDAVGLLGSDERWTFPPMRTCPGCRTSIVELAAGLSAPDGEHVDWVAVAARCVECGRIGGVTDVVLAGRPLAEVRAAL